MIARVVIGALAAAALAAAGCATASGPPASAVAKEVYGDSAEALRGAHTVWLAGAVSRTGSLATGLDEGSSEAATHATASGADVGEELERADRLRCWGCRQPDDLWHWWGVVADRSGSPLASLHGETGGGPDAAALQFVQTVKSLARKSRRGGGGAER